MKKKIHNFFEKLNKGIILKNIIVKYHILLEFEDNIKIFVSSIQKEGGYENDIGHFYKTKFCRIGYIGKTIIDKKNIISYLKYYIKYIEKNTNSFDNILEQIFDYKNTNDTDVYSLGKESILQEISKVFEVIRVDFFHINYLNSKIKMGIVVKKGNEKYFLVAFHHLNDRKNFYNLVIEIKQRISIFINNDFNTDINSLSTFNISIKGNILYFLQYKFIEHSYKKIKLNNNVYQVLFNLMSITKEYKNGYIIGYIQKDPNLTNFLRKVDDTYILTDYASIRLDYKILQPLLLFIYSGANENKLYEIFDYFISREKELYKDILGLINGDIKWEKDIRIFDAENNILNLIKSGNLEKNLKLIYLKYEKSFVNRSMK